MKYEQMLNIAGHQLLKGRPLTEAQFDYFFDYYCETGEMPYGVAKARTGDPYDWVNAKITEEYEQLCAVLQVSALIN
jgi:predicted N-acyltransferase